MCFNAMIHFDEGEEREKHLAQPKSIPGIPKIAVCCPTYGRPDILPTLVGCFVRQNYPADRCELIVLDDGGQLVPYELNDRNGRVVRIYSQEERFPDVNTKRNAMRHLVSPDVDAITFWDDDDVYFPWALEAMGHMLNQTGMAIGNRHIRINRDGIPRRRNNTVHAACAFSLDFFDATGGYVQRKTARGDWDFLCKVGVQTESIRTRHDATKRYCSYLVYRKWLPGVTHACTFTRGDEYDAIQKRPGPEGETGCLILTDTPLPPDMQKLQDELEEKHPGGQKVPIYLPAAAWHREIEKQRGTNPWAT